MNKYINKIKNPFLKKSLEITTPQIMGHFGSPTFTYERLDVVVTFL